MFFIGFNKCGTKTMHFFFSANGYLSMHGKKKPWHGMSRQPFVAVAMEDNVANGEPVLRGFEDYQIFSDLTYASSSRHIEANAFFREFHTAYPDAYFVFNDRPVEKWLRSRVNHVSRRFGGLLDNQMAVLGLPRDAVIEQWRSAYAAHKAAVLEYFNGNPRFMVFDIENDRPEKLVEFLQRDFHLDLSRWKHRGQARAPAPSAAGAA